MGLDIYLVSKDQHAAESAHEKAWDKVYESGRWETMADEAKKAWHAEHPWPSRSDQERPSEKYPDHLFNRRYLRSSYNGGGFDQAVPEMLGTEHGLSWIFEPIRSESDEGPLTSASVDALGTVKQRALQVAEELRACDRLRAITIDHAYVDDVQKMSSDGALAWYREQLARQRPATFGGAYSNRDGWFFGESDSLTVLAACPGVGVLGAPCVHLVIKGEGEGFESYVQSAEIVAEFCDEAIELILKDGSVHMVWSG